MKISVFSCLLWPATLLFALHGSDAAIAQQAPSALPSGVVDAGAASFLNSKRFLFQADAVDQTFVIDVVPVISPVSPPAPGEKLPVVFVVDGNINFPNLASTASMLSLDGLPSMMIVGVGYAPDAELGPVFGFVSFLASRNRDLTPTPDEEWRAQLASNLQQVGAPYPAYGTPGGASDFLTFLDDELKPFIAQQYPMADMDDLTIAGHSLGGLFALNVLLTSPESFDRYIAGSPSLWWDDGVMLERAEEFNDASARLFMSYGSLEPVDRAVEPIEAMNLILSDQERPNLEYRFHVFEGETHDSVIPATFSRGLRAVFALSD